MRPTSEIVADLRREATATDDPVLSEAADLLEQLEAEVVAAYHEGYMQGQLDP